MKIYISSPGQFYAGFNSKLRGEGRWLIHLAYILTQQNHQVIIFSNDPVHPYQQNGIFFDSIHNPLSNPDCDLLIAMEAFLDLPEVHKTPISTLLERFQPKKRIWASFFPIGNYDSPIYDIMPVIHPWNYDQCRNGRAICIPIVTHTQTRPPDFTKTHFHWYSKNAHETPQYLAGVMQGLFELVTKYGASGSFIDGWQISNQSYRDYPQNKEDLTKILFNEIINRGSISFSHWVPYDYAQYLLAKSKLLVGIHHPIAAPSMAEIAAYGGFPVIWENQHKCPPYDLVDIPIVSDSASDEEIRDFLVEIWTNEKLYTETVLVCQEAIRPHSLAQASKIVADFIDSLD